MINMNIRYIYGIRTSEVLNVAFTNIQEDLNIHDENPVIIISSEKEELEKKIRKFGIIDKELRLKILSLEDICKITIKQTEYRNKKILNDYKKQILLSNIICNNDKLIEFYNVSESMNTIQLFNNTIKFLKDRNINIEQLESALINIEDSTTKNKIVDILNVYNSYEAAKGNTYLDNEDITHIAIEKLNEVAYLKKAKVFIIGFEQLNAIEERLLEEIIKRSISTTVILNTDRIDRLPNLDSAHFYKIDLLTKQINDICIRNNISQGENIEVASKEQHFDSLHMKNYLYKYPFKRYEEKTEYLYLNEYDSVYSEIENVALNILQLYRSGISFEKIKIVVPQLDKYIAAIKGTFSKFNIPYCTQYNEKLNTRPIIKMTQALSDLYKNKFLSKDIIKYLKCNKQWSVEQISLLYNYLYTQGIDRVHCLDEYLETIERNNETEQLFILKEVIEAIEELFRKLEENITGIDKCSILFEYIKNIWLGKDFNLEKDEIQMDYYEIEAWNFISTTLSVISDVFESEDISTIHFFDILSFALSNSVTETPSLEIGKVRVVDLKTNIDEDDFVFILNMNEGVVNLKQQPNILLKSLDKNILSRINVNIENVWDDAALIEQYNIYKLLTSTNERLYLSVPLTDFMEKTLQESPIVTRIKQLFNNISELKKYDLKDETLYANLTSKQRSWINSLKLAENIHTEESEFIIENLKRLKDIENYKGCVNTLMNSLNFNNSAECTDKYSLKKLYFDDTFSVSKMERFNNCPFSYFIEYGLRIKPLEKNIPDNRHAGIFIHEIVERFGKRLLKNNMKWDGVTTNYIENEVEVIANIILRGKQRHILKSTSQSVKHIERLKSIAVKSLVAISQHIGNSFFEPIGHEITFGDNSTYPPITIKLNSGKRVKLRGQIDRADKYVLNEKTYIRIIDYKTGDNTLNYNDIYNGLQLQLLTYLDAIISNESKYSDNILPAGVFYMKLNKPVIKATSYDSELVIEEAALKEMRMNGLFTNEDHIPQYMDRDIYDGNSKNSLNIVARFKTDGTLMKATPGISLNDFNILLKFTKETVKKTITNMLEGDISIQPIVKAQHTPCNYCKYKLICLFDETLEGNNYKHIKPLKPAEALEKIRESVIMNHE